MGDATKHKPYGSGLTAVNKVSRHIAFTCVGIIIFSYQI